jgi:hypothetical protein
LPRRTIPMPMDSFSVSLKLPMDSVRDFLSMLVSRPGLLLDMLSSTMELLISSSSLTCLKRDSFSLFRTSRTTNFRSTINQLQFLRPITSQSRLSSETTSRLWFLLLISMSFLRLMLLGADTVRSSSQSSLSWLRRFKATQTLLLLKWMLLRMNIL